MRGVDFFYEDLLKNGHVVLSYDIRGMGASPNNNGNGKSVGNIYNATDQAQLDLKSAIGYLMKMNIVDNSRIEVVGSSY